MRLPRTPIEPNLASHRTWWGYESLADSTYSRFADQFTHSCPGAHLMLHPIDGLMGRCTGLPARTSSSAALMSSPAQATRPLARLSAGHRGCLTSKVLCESSRQAHAAPVTGRLFLGREESNWPW